MKLSGGVAVHMTVEAGDAEAGVAALPVVRRVELLLRKRREQQAQSVELNRRQQVLEQSIVVVD